MIKKILIVTQKVDKNDSVLGFFHSWITAFSGQFDQVIVIGLSVGAYNFPQNVRVVSLGKEKGRGRIARTINFLRYIVALRKEYDGVFVHMNPEYVALAGFIWRSMAKRVVLWYTHRSVNLRLHLAVFFSHAVYTASREGCRVQSNKVRTVGHGIDVELFSRITRQALPGKKEALSIVHVGRITQIKNCDTIIRAVSLVQKEIRQPVRLVFIGAPATSEDEVYKQMLIKLVEEQNLVNQVLFMGSVTHDTLPTFLAQADIMINAAPTGGLDKVVLESMAAGVPVVTSNTSFSALFGTYASQCIFKERDAYDLSLKLSNLISGDMVSLSAYLRQKVSNHALKRLVEIISTEIKSFRS